MSDGCPMLWGKTNFIKVKFPCYILFSHVLFRVLNSMYIVKFLNAPVQHVFHIYQVCPGSDILGRGPWAQHWWVPT